MSLLSSIAELLNKLVPSRKAVLVDKINVLTFKYQRALKNGKDTDAAIYLKQLKKLRQKAGFTGGNV